MEFESDEGAKLCEINNQESLMWDWNTVFKHLVDQCNKFGGYYQLTIQDGARFKNGAIGVGWGEANLRMRVFPEYSIRYPEFDFGIGKKRKYIWCRRKQNLKQM